MVVGEAEVQGQVKRAYELALATRTTGPLTNKLFRAALETGKRVRTETGIGAGRNSVASVAVELAQDVLGDLTDRHVLIVGAGETAELTAEALHDHGVATLFVANRRRDRAEMLAHRFGGGTVSFDQLPGELLRADIVVASTSSPHALIEAEDLAPVMTERGGRALLLIDLAVPRDVEPACGGLPGVTLANVDSMREVVERHKLVRRAEAVRAEGIVEEEIQAFAGWLGQLEVMPTIAALRGRADAIVEQVVAENAGRWESASERDRERVQAMARTVANRLLHEPTLRMKQDSEHRHARMHVLRELFGLEEQAGTGQEAPPAEVRRLHAS
jgi:glutamyl-tRNA reductase